MPSLLGVYTVTGLQSTYCLLPCILCCVLLTVGHKHLDIVVAPERAVVVCQWSGPFLLKCIFLSSLMR